MDRAISVAGLPPSRILIFGQSLGTGISLAVSEHYALQSPPVVFAGAVLVVPFVDVATQVWTYRVAGTIRLLSPIARFPTLFRYLSTFIQDTRSSKDRVAKDIRANEANLTPKESWPGSCITTRSNSFSIFENEFSL